MSWAPHQAKIVPELLYAQAKRQEGRIALRYKDCGIWKHILWEQYAQQVRLAAAGLLALGLPPGGKVSILGDNCPEWLICHLAAMSAGGVTTGIYPTSSAEEITYVVNHSESHVLFVENEEQVDKVMDAMDDLGAKHIIIWDPKGLWGFTHERLIFYDQFMKKARDYLNKNPDVVDRRMERIKPEDTATDHLHLGHHGQAQGRHAQPQQHPGHHRRLHQGPCPAATRTNCCRICPWPISTKT